MIIQLCGRKQNRTLKMHFASWNIRTLQDNPNSLERRTAVIARELKWYNDIALVALSETRLLGTTELIERGAGFTFFCSGLPENEPRQAGVGYGPVIFLPCAPLLLVCKNSQMFAAVTQNDGALNLALRKQSVCILVTTAWKRSLRVSLMGSKLKMWMS